jgi:L-amino acid N-acyltransferase YncA
LGISVRAATPQDSSAVAEVHVDSWQWAYRGQLPDDYLDSLSVDDRLTMWNQRLETTDTGVLVAVDDDGSVMGFASVGPSRDPDAPEGTGELESIYLVAGAAGTGAGSLLMQEAMDELRRKGFAGATLWVLETNQRARRFYERQGWSWDGSRSDHQIECGNRPIVRYRTPL